MSESRASLIDGILRGKSWASGSFDSASASLSPSNGRDDHCEVRHLALHCPTRERLISGLPRVFTELLRAFDYACFTRRSTWDFAVEIETLRGLGLSECDFRWLLSMEFVEHARETTRRNDSGRTFCPLGALIFSRRTCFILTTDGASLARALLNAGGRIEPQLSENRHQQTSGRNDHENGAILHGIAGDLSIHWRRDRKDVPEFDVQRHELRWNAVIVKQFRRPAVNQEAILAAFQEEAWPARIDDPLTPSPELDSKRRLHDAIKCLNRNQVAALLHFRGDGTGEGVVWEAVGDFRCNGA